MAEIIYHEGDTIEIKAPKLTLIFTKREWMRAIRRGKSVLRNRVVGYGVYGGLNKLTVCFHSRTNPGITIT